MYQVLCASADAAHGHALPGGDSPSQSHTPPVDARRARAPELRTVSFQALAYNTPDFLMLQGIVHGTAHTTAAVGGGGSGGHGGRTYKAAARGGQGHRASPDPSDDAAAVSSRGGHGGAGVAVELVKLYRIHAPLYPPLGPASSLGPPSQLPSQLLQLRVFTVLRPDQLAQVRVAHTSPTSSPPRNRSPVCPRPSAVGCTDRC